jgi:hypothetical protein
LEKTVTGATYYMKKKLINREIKSMNDGIVVEHGEEHNDID